MIPERPRPPIERGCKRCEVTAEQLTPERIDYVVVSPTGVAHHGGDDGRTLCGIDARGDDWWWPL